MAYKIADAFGFSEAETRRLMCKINEVGPNTNGYDIQIDDPKILIEVKCNKLIDGKFGAAQLKSMQNDILKLLEPSPEKHKKRNGTWKHVKLLEGSLPSYVPSGEKGDKVYILVLSLKDLEDSLNKILAK